MRFGAQLRKGATKTIELTQIFTNHRNKKIKDMSMN